MEYNVQLQHEKKKYHAVERIRLLLDKESFHEIGRGIMGDDGRDTQCEGVITGHGLIDGKCVYIFSQDFTQQGGSIGLLHGKKIANIIKRAIENKCPVIGIYDSGGARIHEGINALAGCGEMLFYNTLASGYVPQISVVVGPCAGAAAYSPAISDFVFCVNTISNMYITGPSVVEAVTGERCTAEELGGANIHASVSGVAHVICNSEKDCFTKVRKLFNLLPSCCENECNQAEISSPLTINKSDCFNVPSKSEIVYDIINVLNQLVDTDSFFEIQENFATSLLVGFAKIGNLVVGIVASQPQCNGGVLDCDSSDKGARFIRFCDAYNIPIITLVDTPGYLPGIKQEHNGIIRHGAKLLFAFAEATTIKITIIVRKAYGGAYIAMGSKHLGADYVYALPNAEIAVMGAEGAVSIINKKELDSVAPEEYQNIFQLRVEEYTQKQINSNSAIKAGYVDEVIQLSQLRTRLISDFKSLYRERRKFNINKKHNNIPL
jgi:propionyl-CoA carboxylase beta chain